jgi:hypothetical protein
MEGLTRLVSESLARHGFDRPLDYRRLRWSQWFRCESHHSLLFVPSKPGVFALAEEVMDFGAGNAPSEANEGSLNDAATNVPSHFPGLKREASSELSSTQRWQQPPATDQVPEGPHRRMLAVTQFFEDEDMAFVLDRMVSRPNSMNARLTSGRYFARFVVIEDETQRRSICSALNQWIASATEKATGIGSHFASSLELTPATEYVPPSNDDQQSLFPYAPAQPERLDAKTGPFSSQAEGQDTPREALASKREGHDFSRAEKASQILPALAAEGLATRIQAAKPAAPQLNSGAATNTLCPSPFPSGF